MPAYENPPVLVAADILQPEVLNGPSHTVRPQVPSYAGHNQYMIDSDFGLFEANGNTLLAERIAEIRALAALRDFSKTEQYGTALEAAARSPVQLAGNLVKDPVSTISGVPKGVWKFINRAGQAIKETQDQHPPNPYEDPSIEGMIGFSKVKRELAASLEVDPYSSNETLQRELNAAAWASFGGKMTFTVALMPLGGTAGAVASGMQFSDASIKATTDLSAQDLRMRNLALLLNMEIPRADAEAFLGIAAFSPSRSTLLVEALEAMNGVTGQEIFLQGCLVAVDEVDAVFLLRSAQALARIHGDTPLSRIGMFRGFPFGVAQDGSIVLAIEWDYASWTPGVAAFLEELRAEMNTSGMTVALTGTASPGIKTEFERQGYRLIEKCLPGPLAN